MIKLDKRKYSKKEVESLLNEIEEKFNIQIAELSGTRKELVEENKELKDDLSVYKSHESAISGAMIDSKIVANESKKKTDMQYSLIVENLKKFSKRWENYFLALREKYPMYEAVVNANELKNKLDLLLKKGDNRAIVEGAMKLVDDKKFFGNSKTFNPKQKINEYVASTSSNGFNLDEVLTPGELQMEDICKELGLMEDK